MSQPAPIPNPDKSLFQELYELDVSDITRENYQGVKYIPWAQALARIKMIHSDIQIVVNEFPTAEGYTTVPFLKTDAGYFVRVSITIKDHTETETLPVMDNVNKANATPDARAINDNIKRCFVKCLALHGFGLKLYEGEDIHNRNESFPPQIANEVSQTDTSALAETVLTMGKNKGLAFRQISTWDLESTSKWIADLKKPSKHLLTIKTKIDDYLKEVKTEDVPFD